MGAQRVREAPQRRGGVHRTGGGGGVGVQLEGRVSHLPVGLTVCRLDVWGLWSEPSSQSPSGYFTREGSRRLICSFISPETGLQPPEAGGQIALGSPGDAAQEPVKAVEHAACPRLWRTRTVVAVLPLNLAAALRRTLPQFFLAAKFATANLSWHTIPPPPAPAVFFG